MPDLATALRAVLPAGVGVGWADPLAEATGLMAGEALPGAVPKRLAAFAAGRRAARAAMQGLGLTQVAVPMAADRAPIWPAGLVGSISHSESHCVAVVSGGFGGLGIDLEPASELPADLWDTILCADEPVTSGLMAKAAFCAKEAAYKAQFAVSGTLFGFDTLRMALAGNRFSATFRRDVAPFVQGYQINGHLIFAEGQIAALCWLPQVLKIP